MRQFQRVPTTFDTEKRRETVLKLTLIKYYANYLASLQHMKLPINVSRTGGSVGKSVVYDCGFYWSYKIFSLVRTRQNSNLNVFFLLHLK